MITSRNTSVMLAPKSQFTDQDQQAVNALRFMSIDMIERAHSGHPGSPMGMAPLAYTLWEKFMHFSPRDPQWLNRDRFVLSGGHCSALLYSLLLTYRSTISSPSGSLIPGRRGIPSTV